MLNENLASDNVVQVPVNTIANGTNFNSITTPKVYVVPSDAAGETMLNIPRAASGKLIVLARQSLQYILQLYIPSTSVPYIYVRGYNGLTWTPWNAAVGENNVNVAHNGSSGNIKLKRAGNVRVLNFDDVKASTSGISFTSALEAGDRPVNIANGCLFVSTSKTVLAWVTTSGTLSSTGVSTNDTLNGCITWTVN